MWTEGVRHTVLDNGVTLLAFRDENAPVVSVVTHVRAGYLNEPDAVVGISHVLEHMYFKHFPIADEVQRMGGYVNAGTIYDKTVYYTVMPSGNGVLEDTLQLHARGLIDLDVDSGDLSRELEVIIQEANRKKDTPTAVTIETLYGELYAQHRIRRWRIGTEEVLRELTRDDVLSFHNTFYTPNRTIIAMVGDLDPERAISVATGVFDAWDNEGSPTPPEPTETDSPPATFRRLHGDVNRVISVVGWRTPGGLTPDVAALDMAASMLGAGKGSLLGRGIREPGLASSASAHHYTLADIGVFDLFFEGVAENADKTILRGMEIVAALADGELDQDDLTCAKALTSARWSRRLEATDGMASMLCEFEALGGYAMMDEWFTSVMDVSTGQIQEAVSRLLHVEDATSVMYAPHGVESEFTADAWPPHVTARPVESAPLPVRAHEEVSPRSFPRRRYPDGTVQVELPGVDLIVKAKRGTGLAFLSVYADTVRASEDPDQAGISLLLLRTALRGAGSMSAGQLSRFAESLGGPATPMMMLGWVGWGVSVRVESLSDAAALLLEVARDPKLERDALETEMALQSSDAARARDDMAGYPMRQVLERGLPDSWYGYPVMGEPDTIERITLEDVRAWSELLQSRRLAVVVVGDASVDHLIEQTMLFHRWPEATAEPQPEQPFEWRANRNAEPREKAQSAIAMAFPSGTYHSADRFPLAVAASMLSGLSGRLFKELRDDRSLAYSVSASSWLRARAGALLTYIATSPSREEEARTEMLESLVRFARDGFSDDELIRARNYVAGQIQLRRQSTYATASDIISAWLYGDLETLEDVPDQLRAVTAEEVEDLVRRVVKPDGRVEFTLRGGVEVAGQP